MAPVQPPLFRAMRSDLDGFPAVGPSACTLGVRPGSDVVAQNPDDWVYPGQGGMSVSPRDPRRLPPRRRPPHWGGTSRDEVWSIAPEDLGPDLQYRPDPRNPDRHGFIEPARPMTLHEYQEALGRTRTRWKLVLPGP